MSDITEVEEDKNTEVGQKPNWGSTKMGMRSKVLSKIQELCTVPHKQLLKSITCASDVNSLDCRYVAWTKTSGWFVLLYVGPEGVYWANAEPFVFSDVNLISRESYEVKTVDRRLYIACFSQREFTILDCFFSSKKEDTDCSLPERLAMARHVIDEHVRPNLVKNVSISVAYYQNMLPHTSSLSESLTELKLPPHDHESCMINWMFHRDSNNNVPLIMYHWIPLKNTVAHMAVKSINEEIYLVSSSKSRGKTRLRRAPYLQGLNLEKTYMCDFEFDAKERWFDKKKGKWNSGKWKYCGLTRGNTLMDHSEKILVKIELAAKKLDLRAILVERLRESMELEARWAEPIEEIEPNGYDEDLDYE